ncbi:MAG: 16S rRNA (guanine(527)-N(7))-methyltransferase RsmG [Candidatus Acidiferrales bacterium]
MNISNDLITDSLLPYGVTVTLELRSSIRVYLELLLRWNQQISLTTVTKPEDILRFHFGESAFAANAFRVERGRLADVGPGAGFPGLPLKLVRPELDLFLIESNSRKAVFLQEVVRAMSLEQVKVIRSRAKDLTETNPKFDIVTARAVGRYDELISWATRQLAPNGRLILWLGEADVRAISATPGWEWSDPVLIPASKNRYILQGDKKRL